MTEPSIDLVPESVRSTIGDLDPRQGQHIGGVGRAALGGRTFPVTDKATTEVIADYSDGGPAEAREAVDAAHAAFSEWSSTSPRQRAETLRAAFDLMSARADGLARLISAENGKSVSDSRAEVHYAADFLRWFSEEAVRLPGHFGESPAGGTRTVVTTRPVGVSALVTPWNFPAAMATRKIGPALAAGCTVVLKPAAETPLTALAVVRLLEEAGVPPGVVNLVATSDPASVVETWLHDSRVRKMSFTGSTGVGRVLLSHAANRIINSTMELGGNAPFVVAADADVEAAVAGAMIAKFRNGGQACTAANRFYVHESVAEEFVATFGSVLGDLKVGSAFEDGTHIGPLINDRAVSSMEGLVDDALNRGARVSRVAVTSDLPGHFYPPTLLVDVPPDAAIVQTEIFGPVAPVVTWKDDDALLSMLNGTELGLAAYVYSRDIQWALQLGERLEVGMVGVNRGALSDAAAPFGGVKQSGLGREGGRDGILAFTETQYTSIQWS